MMTAKGLIPDDQLFKDEVVEEVPCGKCVRSRYFDSEGDLVREDVEIKVNKAALIGGRTGDQR